MKRTIQSVFSFTSDGLAKFASQVSALFDRPRASLRFSIGGEVTDARRVTMQVVGRSGLNAAPNQDYAENPTSNRFLIVFRVGTAEWGAPAGTQTLAVATGTLIKAHTADQLLLVETDANGVAAVDVTVSGAGTRYVTATIGEESASSGAIAWA